MKRIEKGTQISAKHIKSEEIMHYSVVEERESGLLRLLNLKTHYLMNGFKARDEEAIIRYIEVNLKCEIINIQ